jgi:hypothetical protein
MTDAPVLATPPQTAFDQLEQSGYTLLRGVYGAGEIELMREDLAAALQVDSPTVLKSRGRAYGARDLIALLPAVCDIPHRTILKEFLTTVLGPGAGLVRALYFDKPPDRSWSLTWHKDWTIAVKNTELPSTQFRCPTLKSGIPHVEAPEWLLANMLTLRLHLDAMTAENGPLSVIPGSHIEQNAAPDEPMEIHAQAGDVLAMRPLLTHSSSQSKPETTLHRRVVHLEFASNAELPDGYEWHSFHRVN